MSTPEKWLKKAGTRVEGGKGLYEEEDQWVDILALHRMESWAQTTGLTSMGLSILARENFLGLQASKARQSRRGDACQMEPAHSMRDAKEAFDGCGRSDWHWIKQDFDGRKNKSKPIRGGGEGQKLHAPRLLHTLG